MSESQELVHISPPLPPMVAAPEVDETGLDSVALKPSDIILVQNSTRQPGTARPGQFLDTLSMEVFDEVTLVPLKITKQRVLFPPGEDLDAEPLCRSNDGVVPSTYVKAPQSRNCATCPQSQWVDGKKSACAEKLRILGVMKETGVPYFLTVGGKGVSMCKQAIQLIKRYIAMQDANIKAGKTNPDGSPLQPLRLYDFFFTVKGEMVNSKYRYAVARFENIKRVANIGDFGALFSEFVTRRRVDQEQEQAVQAEAQTDAAVSQVVDAEFVEEV
jgi:hypothetical protein